MRSLIALLILACPAIAADIPAQRAAELEHLVLQDCGSCHGLTKKGGLGSPLVYNAIAHYDPDTLSAVILDGVPGTAMPPWRPLLSEDDAMWIALYLLKEPEQ